MLIKVGKYRDKILLLSVIAAATENNNDSEDDDPSAVIVEKMAKAVVVHRYVPPKNVCDPRPHIISYAEEKKAATQCGY